jgi:superoxide dismutase
MQSIAVVYREYHATLVEKANDVAASQARQDQNLSTTPIDKSRKHKRPRAATLSNQMYGNEDDDSRAAVKRHTF